MANNFKVLSKMNRIFIVSFIILLIPACMTSQNTEQSNLSSMKCYNSFQEFAYILPEYHEYRSGLPTEPWKIESNFPSELVKDYDIQWPNIRVMFSRSVNGNPEIWLANPSRFLEDDAQSIFVYHPESGEWFTIPDNVEDTNTFIRGVYQAGNGTIWGWNGWEQSTIEQNSPVFSIFNEQTKQFEFIPGMLERPMTDEGKNISHGALFDSQGNIWILVSNDGLYLYDPVSQTTTKQIFLPEMTISNFSMLSNDTIYLTDNTYMQRTTGNTKRGNFSGMLYQFFPENDEILEVGIPDQPWPWFGSMVETSDQKVWFSAIGYHDLSDGSWHLSHPDPEYAFERAGYQGFSSPNIILESSDGILWFNKENEDMFTGTAWYNPETGKGCMFTSFSARIIEDDQQQLWMFAAGKLYRLSLEG